MPARGTILIVEDNADHLELFTDAFVPDYEVVAAGGGEECLQILSQRHFDLVVLDYYLGGQFSGLDVLCRIADEDPALPVIMVTAYGNEELAVKAMKFGAKDYIRKTLDNSYVERIRVYVEEILERKQSEETTDVRQDVLGYFQQNRSRFIRHWRESMQALRKRVGLAEAVSMDEAEIDRFFTAFLADIQNDRATETLLFLKKMVLLQDAEEKSLLMAELLNMSLKDSARVMLRECYPDSFDNRSAVMAHIAMLVNENDLELSKEYEKLIWQASERARQSERLATKATLMTTLQHEIRQPLAYILNTVEMLLADRESVSNETLGVLLEQTRRIEDLLDRLERDSHMRTKKYSDDLSVIDTSESKE